MIIKELLGPPNLLKAETLYTFELTEVVMIYENKDLVLTVFQVMTPSFKCFNNS